MGIINRPKIQLNDEQFYRLLYSVWDFQQALSALTFLMEECDFETKYTKEQLRKFRCYETTIIISFARPFEVSRGRTSLGLKAADIQLSKAEKVLKTKLLALRRKVIAHSDEEFMHFHSYSLKPLDNSELRFPFLKFDESLHIELTDLVPLENFLHKLIKGISSLIFRIAQDNPEKLELYKSPRLRQVT